MKKILRWVVFVMCITLFILYLLHIFRCTLMGLGNASAPFWSGVMEFFARVSIAILFTKWFGIEALYFAEPGAWLASVLVLIPVCLKMIQKFYAYRFRNISATSCSVTEHGTLGIKRLSCIIIGTTSITCSREKPCSFNDGI